MRMCEDIRLEISPKTAVVGVIQLGVLIFSLLAIGMRRHAPRFGARRT